MANNLGRRNNADMRRMGLVPKAELYAVVEELYALGIGTTMIGKVLGYGRDYIRRIRNATEAERRRRTEEVLLNLLPQDLKRRALSIRVRSEQFYSCRGRTLRDGRPRGLDAIASD